jgi:CTP:molybdopterin cytidylyltransferase MocA
MSDRGRRDGEPAGAVLLAAGESTRMGQLKALLPWDGRPLLSYAVDQLLASPVERVAVVLGHRSDELRALLPADGRLLAVDNPDYLSGKVSSIVAGVTALPAACHVLVLGVDQPRPEALLRRVVADHLASGAPITVAAFGGRRGHPVLFVPELRAELLGLDEATEGMRAILRRHAAGVRLSETGSALALVNLNRPEDYAAARREFLAAG